jgi:hypothetical protein
MNNPAPLAVVLDKEHREPPWQGNHLQLSMSKCRRANVEVLCTCYSPHLPHLLP